jgi:protoporphyrinogen oxidase
MSKHFEALVIGGGIAGLITSLILTKNGYRVLLLEKEKHLGGTNRSFRNARGDVFDFGYHTLDYNRSPFTTKVFAQVLNGRFHSFSLKRGMVIRGHVIRYNAPISEWPEDISRHVEKSDFLDTLDGPPTRESISTIFGEYLTRIAFDEILPSYPCLAWERRNGKPESDLMGQIYPWFFPRSVKNHVSDTEWSKFHQAVRDKDEHVVLYPDEGGFGAFVDGIADQIDTSNLTLRTGLSKLDVSMENPDQKISYVDADGDRFTADRYFWCAPLTLMGRLINFPFPSVHPQTLCLGSYAFDEELPFHFHEILVGDKNIPINRISFPGKIAGGKNNLVQLEYVYPVGDGSITEETWKAAGLDHLVKLNLVPRPARVANYHFFSANKGFVSIHDPLKILADLQGLIRRETTNIVYPYIGLEVDNINRIIPSVFREVYRVITS